MAYFMTFEIEPESQ